MMLKRFNMKLHYALLLVFSCFLDNSQQRILGCNSRQADVIFLLDTSGSVGKDNFETEKQFILNFTEAVNIGPNEVQVGVVKYSSVPTTEISLNESNIATDLKNSIQHIAYESGSTRTHQALKYIYHHGFTIKNGDRSTVPNFLVVLTDGLSFYGHATDLEAQRLHNASVTVYAIGIGNNINTTELVRIASNAKHMFIVPGYTALHEIQKELQPIACHSLSSTTNLPIIYTQPPDPCSSSPCHFGHCYHDNINYVCICQPGYHGKNCDQDRCSSLPCKNGGKCYHNVNDYVCICSKGFSGKNCENAPTVQPGFCTSKPCFNGGRCFEDQVKFICICPAGYTGDQCTGITTVANKVSLTTTNWLRFTQNPVVGRR